MNSKIIGTVETTMIGGREVKVYTIKHNGLTYWFNNFAQYQEAFESLYNKCPTYAMCVAVVVIDDDNKVIKNRFGNELMASAAMIMLSIGEK